MTLGALALYLIVWLVAAPGRWVSRLDFLVLVGIVVVGATAYYVFYRALAIGPVAVVSPVVAAYSAVVVALSLIFLGESMSKLQAIGAAGALIGVVLASADLRALPQGMSRIGKGLWLAVAALLCFGVSTFGGGIYAKKYDFITAAFIGRILMTIVFYGAVTRKRAWPWGHLRGNEIVKLFLLGVIESAGYLFFTKGAETGAISIVAVATTSYPLIPMILGVGFLKERPAPNQWAGIMMVLLGVLLIGTA